MFSVKKIFWLAEKLEKLFHEDYTKYYPAKAPS